jgi:hypothetical protein
MKHKLVSIFSFFILLSISTSCILGPTVTGNGDVTKQKRSVDSFEKVNVTRGLNVYISQGENQKLVVEADENLLDYIETDVEDNTLNVTTTAFIRRSKSLKVFIVVTDLKEVKATAGSNVNSEENIECGDLDISGSAGSNIYLQINADDIDVSASSGSNITLEGNANNSKLKASSGSNVKAEALEVNGCEAKTSSGANIWIKVKNEMDGHASSGGNIFYYGNPKMTNIEESSGGNVIHRD